jgi:type I restriction-modification system DNA methylase subunit
MSDIGIFKEKLNSLISKFEKDKSHYLSKGYLEAQVRIDFINPFFKALGWDIENKSHKPPHERDVIVELSPETTGRPDYNFRINGSTKFFIEVKSPSVALDDINHILQAKSYAWSTKEVYFVVLTDFEEFRLYDASLKPNPRFPNEGLVFDFKYTDYLDNIERLWELSRERVEQGSLELLLPKDTKSKRLRIPPDKSFLEDLTVWRTELAKDIHKRNPEFDVKLLNDVVQRLLDRIVFIRIAEDRKIRPDRELWEIVAQWKEEAKRKSIMVHLRDLFKEVNDDLNGDIFKPHACETADVDSSLLAEIIENLYFPKSRYRFDAIGVELLGSIYERYLGSTIRVTPQRVKVEEKPEVRKAGGVYYTPKYIVDYIVKNTVGRVIEGKTPRQIEKIKILDPACGSGSFLLGAYQYLIDYHLKYYREHPKKAQTLHLFPYWKISPEEFSLPIHEKAKILRNNIFGVDIDPQAVEITMMSLYLKALEGERGLLPKKQHLLPPLSSNIKCGNSLIDYDIFDSLFSPVIPAEAGIQSKKTGFRVKHGMTEKEELTEEDRSRINPFDWNSKSTGFGEILNPSQSPIDKGGSKGGFDCVIGNPPYVRVDYLQGQEKKYFKQHYVAAQGKYDLYYLFIEKSFALLKDGGVHGFIVPNKFCTSDSGYELRRTLIDKSKNIFINSVSKLNIFEKIANYPVLLFFSKTKDEFKSLELAISENISDLNANKIVLTLNSKQINALPQFLFPINANMPSLKIFFKAKKKNNVLGDFLEISEGFRIPKRYERSKGDEHIIKQYQFSRYSSVEKGSFINISKRREIISDDSLRYLNCFKPKIIIAEDALQMEATLDISKSLCQGGVYFGAKKNDVDTYSLNYLLALLNSRLLTFIYKMLFSGMHMGGGYLRFRTRFLNHLPIRTIDFNNPSEKAIHDKLVSLVDRMLELHKKKSLIPPSSERDKIEREIAVTDEKIDELVYGLYGVMEEERGIVEGK